MTITAPYSKLIKLALPIIIQNLLISSMGFIDLLMIGQLGDISIAAVGLASQFTYIFLIVQYGIHSGVSVFTAQYWGQKEIGKIQSLMGISILFGLIISVIFFLLAFITPRQIISLFTSDIDVIYLGCQYLRITSIAYFPLMLTYAFVFNLKSTEEVKVPMYICAVSVSVNIGLNYLLIFGKFGFPALGVVGAAYATLISKCVECTAVILITYIRKYPCSASLSTLFQYDFSFIKNVIDRTWPVFVHDFAWVIGISVYKIIYARISTESIAAINIIISIEDIAFILFFGLTGAGSIMTGNKIGQGKESEAFSFSKNLLFIEWIMGLAVGVILLLFSNHLLSFYNITQTTADYTHNLLILIGLVFWIKTVNMGMIIGLFHAGGDTHFCLFLELGGVWLIGIPAAIIGAFVFHLPIYWVAALVALEEVFKLSLGLPRFFSGKWISNLVS